jgi:exonuclease III
MSWQAASLNSPEKAREKSLKNGRWGGDASGIRLIKTSVSIVPAKYAEWCRYFESLEALGFSRSLRQKERHPNEYTIWDHESQKQRRVSGELEGALSKPEPRGG